MAWTGLGHGLALLAGLASAATGVSAHSLAERYEAAVRDASQAEASEIADDLVAVTKSNDSLVWNEDRSKVLVATWKSEKSYEEQLKGRTATSESEEHVVWVTLAPKMRRHCHAARTELVGNAKRNVSLAIALPATYPTSHHGRSRRRRPIYVWRSWPW